MVNEQVSAGLWGPPCMSRYRKKFFTKSFHQVWRRKFIWRPQNLSRIVSFSFEKSFWKHKFQKSRNGRKYILQASEFTNFLGHPHGLGQNSLLPLSKWNSAKTVGDQVFQNAYFFERSCRSVWWRKFCDALKTMKASGTQMNLTKTQMPANIEYWKLERSYHVFRAILAFCTHESQPWKKISWSWRSNNYNDTKYLSLWSELNPLDSSNQPSVLGPLMWPVAVNGYFIWATYGPVAVKGLNSEAQRMYFRPFRDSWNRVSEETSQMKMRKLFWKDFEGTIKLFFVKPRWII